MANQFPRFFDPAELGTSLKEVATDILSSSGTDLVSRWFHSNKDADLYIWMDKDRRVIKQQLSFYGQIVEWNAIEGIKTGHVVIEEDRDRSHGSEILRFDEIPQGTSIRQALDLLAHVRALSEPEREALARNFNDANSVKMPTEEFMLRFGRIMDALTPPKARARGGVFGFFRKFWSWFLG